MTARLANPRAGGWVRQALGVHAELCKPLLTDATRVVTQRTKLHFVTPIHGGPIRIKLSLDASIFQFVCIAATTYMSDKHLPRRLMPESLVKFVSVAMLAQRKNRRLRHRNGSP